MRQAIERRAFEFRVEDDGADRPTLAGVVIPYGQRASIGGRFTEEFRAGGLTFADVIANVMHVRERPLARVGGALTLQDTETALRARLALPDTVDGRDAATLVREGVLKGFSAEFRATRDRWEGSHRIIEAATVSGLAVVDKPAYAGAVISEGRMLETADWFATMPAGRTRRWRSL